MEVFDYITVGSIGSTELDKAVKEKLNNGWQPYGNPHTVVVQGNDGTATVYCYQAMVKYKKA
jgi:hypothetical protein